MKIHLFKLGVDVLTLVMVGSIVYEECQLLHHISGAYKERTDIRKQLIQLIGVFIGRKVMYIIRCAPQGDHCHAGANYLTENKEWYSMLGLY